jgi:PKD repeat protein
MTAGTAGSGHANDAGLAATWNPSTGATTITVASPYGTDTDPFSWYDSGDGDDPTGAATTLTLTMGMTGLSPTNPRDLLVMEIFKPSPSRYIDVGVWMAIPGDSTLHTFAGALTALFSASPTSGIAPLTVNFTDLSTAGPGGAITAWAWDFGDGGTSTSQNPSHTFTAAGTYTVSLTVTSPDGTSSVSHTEIVIAAGTNVSPSTALALVGCDSLTWNTDSYPRTPTGTDYPTADGWGMQRQAWFKIHNPSPNPAYARINVENSGTTTLNVQYIPYGVHSGAIVTPTIADNDWGWLTSGYVQPPYDASGVYNTSAGGAGLLGYVGVLVPPGEDVLFVVGIDDSTHAPSGTLTMEYGLFPATEFDLTDTQPPPSNPLYVSGEGSYPGKGDGGFSDTIPAGGGNTLDYTGFPNWPASSTGFPSNSGLLNSTGSCFDGTHWWIAKIYINDTGTNSDDAEVIYEYLGVWQFDASGNFINFNVIDTVQSGYEHGPIGHDYGLTFKGTGAQIRMCSDGSDVWLVVGCAQPQTNLYDSSIPPHDWASASATVYSKSSGWSRIGCIQAQSHNMPFGAGGAGSAGFLCFDACASPNQPGILHVIQSEFGGKSGDRTQVPPTPSTTYLTYGIAGYLWATTYATFDGSGRTSQTVVSFTDDPSGTSADPHVQNSTSEFCWVRNDHGSPVFMWIASRTDGTNGPQALFEIRSLPSFALLGSFDATFAAGAGITTTAYGMNGGHSNYGGLISTNAFHDVGFDNRQIYLVYLACSPLDTYVVARVPTDTWTARYVADTGSKSFRGMGALGSTQNASFLASGDQLAIWGFVTNGGTTGYEQFIYCAGQWLKPLPSYGGTHQFPTFLQPVGLGKNDGILVGDYFKNFMNYTHPVSPYPVQTWLGQTHIWRKAAVCSINAIDCLALCNGPIWFFVNGQWRQAGVDPDWNVYGFKDGSWHPVCTDPNVDAYVQFQGAWVPG